MLTRHAKERKVVTTMTEYQSRSESFSFGRCCFCGRGGQELGATPSAVHWIWSTRAGWLAHTLIVHSTRRLNTLSLQINTL